jgi:acetyl-CoA synthetase
VSSHDASATTGFLAARDLLHALWDDHDAAVARFVWPRPPYFNWALDWFDRVAVDNTRTALRMIDAWGVTAVSYAELSECSNRVANRLRRLGLRRGQRVLLMLDNQVAVWETILAAMKLGAVVMPIPAAISAFDLKDVLSRPAIGASGTGASVIGARGIGGDGTTAGEIGGDGTAAGEISASDASTGDAGGGKIGSDGIDCIITADRYVDAFSTAAPRTIRICVGERVAGWHCYADAYAERREFTPDGDTAADDPLFIHLTSGTTGLKLACHTHAGYPIGTLPAMYWSGLLPGDVHLNVAEPGSARHTWSSFFGPFNAEATVVAVNASADVSPGKLREVLDQQRVSSLCAPPAVWEMLARDDSGSRPTALREACSIGAPLASDLVELVHGAWGIHVRNGYGQTETAVQIGATVGLPVRPGALGRPLPGCPVVLLDPRTGKLSQEGEICVDLAQRPINLITEYLGDRQATTGSFADGYYHTGDFARRDPEGWLISTDSDK